VKTSRVELERMADTQGHRGELLEKVLWMLDLLQAIYQDKYLSDRLALKGGTALNLFVLNFPRLSVDIDLNYIGSADLTVAEKERPEIVNAISRLCRGMGLNPGSQPDQHAGGKWHLNYPGHITASGNLEVDLNFLQRVPLWPTTLGDSVAVGKHQAKNVRIMDIHELAAGKLTALLSRTAARDLFDAASLADLKTLDIEKLRLAFVVYGSGSRTDWRTVTTKDITVDPKDIENRLVPMLSETAVPTTKDLHPWISNLSEKAHRFLEKVLPLSGPELAFLERLLESGEIEPDLLTKDAALAGKIQTAPGILWKAKNVKSYKKGTK
jgi:predicted nucleotidyltransferase component of viral defense system